MFFALVCFFYMEANYLFETTTFFFSEWFFPSVDFSLW